AAKARSFSWGRIWTRYRKAAGLTVHSASSARSRRSSRSSMPTCACARSRSSRGPMRRVRGSVLGLFGSAAMFGRLASSIGDRRDRDGVSIAEALRALGERGDPAAARRDPAELAAYLELHIEQEPRLERAGLPLGVVSDIVGIYHARVTIRGRADHAGATVMTARADALAAASEIVLAVERIARARPDSVGTVGEIAVRPGAKNVVPGESLFSLDLRAARDHDGLVREVLTSVTTIAGSRGVEASVDELARVPVTSLDPKIREVLRHATR